MRIFTSKLPRSWKSSGVMVKSDQLEMSNFSFIEDYFISSSRSFNITIIGKNIIGNGIFSISVYKESFLVWQEEHSFMGASFSKKQIQIEESSGEKFKIVISRGKKSKGKILLNQVFIYQEKKKEVKPESNPVEDSLEEDEPTFFFENPKVIVNPQPEELVILPSEIPEAVPKDPIAQEPAIAKKKVRKRKAKYIRTVLQREDDLVHEVPQDVIEYNPPIFTESPIVIDPLAKRAPSDTWVTIIDFNFNGDERSVFNYLNQISFGSGRQIFFVKQCSEEPVDFSKYDHVKVFFNDEDIVTALESEWPKKITFTKENLCSNLLVEIERIKDEISR